ncbi:hypothetical protein TNCV_1634471 [Trichonephila clavipes]|nr:hypothetical protein TNCV_1634471 [Trichonephila clavipes]
MTFWEYTSTSLAWLQTRHGRFAAMSEWIATTCPSALDSMNTRRIIRLGVKWSKSQPRALDKHICKSTTIRLPSTYFRVYEIYSSTFLSLSRGRNTACRECGLSFREFGDPTQADGIIGPYFFKNDEGHNVTVNGDRYRAMITNFFIPELNNHDVQELWFQQDGATCHTARATIDLLKDTFGPNFTFWTCELASKIL